ncbi:hypothetical protein [Serratia marcescens]|uniref:hypothetical protein n=1 Tax=Serratia marcescens TaxID=615 RepID=UPI003F84E943
MKQLKIIASAGALLLVSMQVQAGDIISSVASTTTEFKVVNSAEAEVTVSARKDLAAGSVADAFVLGNWSASVTAGTFAYRLNSSINTDITNARFGYSVNKDDATKRLKIRLDGHQGATTLIDGWRVYAQGITGTPGSGGRIYVDTAQVLVAGRYPVGIDVAAYAF